MNIKTNEYNDHSESEQKKDPDQNYRHHKHSSSYHKNPYVGLTLMEYFKISNSKEGLEEIDEQSNSSISAGTPCFAESKDKASVVSGSKMARRDKLRIQSEQQLLPSAKEDQDHVLPKVATINFDSMAPLDKNSIKLPSIHQHRHINNSRQGMVKDGKLSNKKESWKSKNQQNNSYNNNSSLNKVQKTRMQELQRNALIMKKSIRARVTSTSFYHPSLKERQRERIRTEQQSMDKNLEKSFIVTKYGGLSIGAKKSKEEIHLQTWKKNENTFKLLKSNNG